MNKGKISPQTRRQIGQLNDEVIEDKREIPSSEMPIIEKGVDEEKAAEQQAINQMKSQREEWAKKRIKEIEDEVHLLAQKRQEEMRKRREEVVNQEQQGVEGKKAQDSQPLEISSKPKKGMPFWGKRIKTAQQQAQPETAGRRTGG
jgi:hypothetical protein